MPMVSVVSFFHPSAPQNVVQGATKVLAKIIQCSMALPPLRRACDTFAERSPFAVPVYSSSVNAHPERGGVIKLSEIAFNTMPRNCERTSNSNP